MLYDHISEYIHMTTMVLINSYYDKQTNRPTKQTNKQTSQPTNRPTDQQQQITRNTHTAHFSVAGTFTFIHTDTQTLIHKANQPESFSCALTNAYTLANKAHRHTELTAHKHAVIVPTISYMYV